MITGDTHHCSQQHAHSASPRAEDVGSRGRKLPLTSTAAETHLRRVDGRHGTWNVVSWLTGVAERGSLGRRLAYQASLCVSCDTKIHINVSYISHSLHLGM